VKQPHPSASLRWTIRGLAIACILLSAICLYLAGAWRTERETVMCFRDALVEGATPAVAEADCLDPPPR
jgi:hypothetical protein